MRWVEIVSKVLTTNTARAIVVRAVVPLNGNTMVMTMTVNDLIIQIIQFLFVINQTVFDRDW